MMTGLVMASIRAREPYFKFLLKSKVYEWFGILMDEKEITESEQYMNDTLVTFLTSSLNVELVHIILESITKYSKAKAIVPDMANYLNYKEQNFKEKNCFSLDTIKIRNPEKWKVAKLSEFLIEEYDLKLTPEARVTVKSYRVNDASEALLAG